MILKEDIDNYGLAIAWNELQSSFDESFSKKILNFEKMQGLKINSVLEICSRSGNILNSLADSGKKCVGIETSEEFYNYCKNKYQNIKFYKTETMLDFDMLGKFDLIVCSHQIINTLEGIERWELFFEKIYSHLTNGGIFIFDYLSKNKLSSNEDIKFSELQNMDTLKRTNSTSEFLEVFNSYYLNINSLLGNSGNNEVKVKKVDNNYKFFSYDNYEILLKIKNAKFRYLIKTDNNFSPVSDIDDMSKIHIIAIKREKVIRK